MLKLLTRFVLTGDFNPDEITSVLGIQPSKAQAKGDPSAETELLRQSSWWFLDSGLDRESSLETQAETLLKLLAPCWSELIALSQRYDAGIS